MILRDLINIQKETSPNQVPLSILKLYKKIFKKLDTLWETDPNTILTAIHTLANMATGPLVQQVLVDSKNLSILKKILIYALVNEQHSTIEALINGFGAAIAGHNPIDKSISSSTTPETKEYAPKTPSP